MRYLIVWAALVGAAAAYIGPSYAGGLSTQPSRPATELSHRLDEDESSSSSTTTPATTPSSKTTTSSSSMPATDASSTQASNPVQELVSELPITLPPLLQELEASKRRVITYDQRQEGQYNIRADLDNFMIVLIPPSPSEGLSLLDILTKSGKSSFSSSKKKKHYASALSLKPESGLKFRHALKSSDYFPRQSEHSERAFTEMARGTYPEEEVGVQARLNPDHQVDVLPPPYPLAYQHLMKPYLEAESSIIQTLPPADLEGHARNPESSHNSNGFYRFARYIRGDNYLDTSRATTSNHLSAPSAVATSRRIGQIPIYRSDLSMGAAQLYPPIDAPHYNSVPSTARSFEDNKQTLTSAEDIESEQSLDGGELTYEDFFLPSSFRLRPLKVDASVLHSDSLTDGEAKALLSDGIERCAPGKRRDSYGVCREIEGY